MISKGQFAKIVILSVLITWLLNILVGRFFVAKISTWPLLNRLHILSPQAPIVITNRETVRVSDSGDVVQAASDIKSKISTLVLVNSGTDTVVGSAVNLTSDGSFVTAAGSFGKTSGNYFIVLSDGRSAKITDQVLDPATSVIFFKANLSAVPTANLASSKDATVGEKIIFTVNSLQNFTNKAMAATVSSAQSDIAGQIFQSDYPKRGFGAQAVGSVISGEAIIDTGSNILGIWNGSSIISSDVLKAAMNLYFADNQNINRPSFGFSYSIISVNEAALSGQTQGALVKDASGVAAKQAGLLVGDTITSVNDALVSESSPLEEILQNFKPGDKLNLNVTRKNQTLTLILTAGELK